MGEHGLEEGLGRRDARHGQQAGRVAQRLLGEAELAPVGEGVAEHALDDALRVPGRQSQFEAATEGVAQQAHAIDALVVDSELQALDGMVEAPALRQGEDGRDHHAHAVGEQPGERQVGLGLHGVAVQEDEGRPLAEVEVAERSGCLGGHASMMARLSGRSSGWRARSA